MFAGITALAIVTHVHMAEDPRPADRPARPGQAQKTALSQIGLAVFGAGPAFYLLQAFTAAILVLAANTAYNGFPVLGLAARPRRLPAPAAGPARRPAGVQQRHRAARRGRRRC